MKRFLLVATAALLASACTTTDDEMAVADEVAPIGMSTATYVPAASSGDLLEIQSGQLALERSCDPAVRHFAQMIVNDHGRMSSEMAATTRALNLPPPPTRLAPHHQEMLHRLSMASGPAFEGEFRNAQVAAHQEALELHRTYADTGEHAPLRALADAAVPAIEAHLGHAQSLPTMAQCAMQTQPRPGERG